MTPLVVRTDCRRFGAKTLFFNGPLVLGSWNSLIRRMQGRRAVDRNLNREFRSFALFTLYTDGTAMQFKNLRYNIEAEA